MSKFGRIIPFTLKLLFLCYLLWGLPERMAPEGGGQHSNITLVGIAELENEIDLDGKIARLTKVPYPRQHTRCREEHA